MSECKVKKCRECDFTHNGLNGLYCEYLEAYVEHALRAYCETNKKD